MTAHVVVGIALSDPVLGRTDDEGVRVRRVPRLAKDDVPRPLHRKREPAGLVLRGQHRDDAGVSKQTTDNTVTMQA